MNNRFTYSDAPANTILESVNGESPSIVIEATVKQISGSSKTNYCFKNIINTVQSVSFVQCLYLNVIGKYAFYQCANLEKIDLSMCTNLQKIDDFAFSSCTKINILKLPEGLVYLGQFSFSAIGISSIEIPSTVTTISQCCFLGCKSLTTVTFAPQSSLDTIERNSFSNSPLTGLSFPASIKVVYGSAFYQNTNFENMKIEPENNYLWTDGTGLYNSEKTTLMYVASAKQGTYKVIDGVTSLADGCFISTQLSEVILPNSVVTIGTYTFTDSKIASINLPDSITKIGDNCFSGCKQLKTITLPPLIKQIATSTFDGSGLTTITIPEGVTKIGNSAFANCGSLTSIHAPSTLKELGGGVTKGSPNAKYIFSETSNIYILNDILILDRDNTSISQYLGIDQSSVFIPCTVKTILPRAFEGKSKLQTITSDGDISLEIIDNFAFSGCSSLSFSFNFGSIKRIGESAFMSTSLSNSIHFGSNLESIGKRAFYNCKSITSVTFSSSVNVSVGDESFMECSSISSVSFDSCNFDVRLGNSAFSFISGLSSVTITNNIKSIGSYCFSSSGLHSVTFDNDVTSISSLPVGLFKNCSQLSSLTLPSGISAIGPESLSNTSINSVTIPDSVKILGELCFRFCRSLKSITISDNSLLERIDYGVFSGCISFSKINAFRAAHFVSSYGALYNSDMTEMYVYPPASPSRFFALSDSITYIAESAFIGCVNLESILIPDKSVTTIGRRAFEGCINLRHINIPSCVERIGEDAFVGCPRLTCGSVIIQNRTTTFIAQLISAGLSNTTLSECQYITCRATYYLNGFLLLYVFICM